VVAANRTRAGRISLAGRLFARAQPCRRRMPPPLAAGQGGRPPIAAAADWPPVQAALDLKDFAQLPQGRRSQIAMLLDPPCERLRHAVLNWLDGAAPPADAETAVASAMAACCGELAELIAVLDRYNAVPDSPYRIMPRLKLFLIECAIGEVAESAERMLAERMPRPILAAA